MYITCMNIEAQWRHGVSAELGLYDNTSSMVEQDLKLRRALASIEDVMLKENKNLVKAIPFLIIDTDNPTKKKGDHPMSKDTRIDFEGQDFYIGLDIHKKSWSVAIRNNRLRLKTFSMDPSPERLKQYLNRNYPEGHYHVVYEVGYSGFWICRTLRAMGIDCIVVNPADIPTAHKEKDQKADPVDAGKLARELEKGELKCIYIPKENDQHLRSLCRLYRKMVQDTTRVKNRIKGHLYLNGVELPFKSSYWSGKMLSHMESLPLDNGPGKDYLMLCLDELRYYREQTVTILRKVRRYVNGWHSASVFHKLLTIPGVGFKTAITLYSEIIDINRFPNFERLKSYVGLVPSISISGETEYTRGLTYRSNKLLKYVLIECAWVAIRKDPALLHCYNKLIVRMKTQEAIVRIAVKLLRRIRYVWQNNTPYVCGIVQ